MSKTFRKADSDYTKQSKQTNVKQQRKAKQQYKWLSDSRE